MATTPNDYPSSRRHTSSKKPSRQKKLRRGAIGIMDRGDRFLMIRRAKDIVLGGRWCFPGGHIEVGENSRQAIIREFREELGIEIQPTHKLGYIKLSDAGYILAVWLVSFLSGDIKPAPLEISDLRWVFVDEIPTTEPGLPSNSIAYDMIKRASES